ncbi:MAG: alpha/beta hydrolase [Waddliaceae bacterium]
MIDIKKFSKGGLWVPARKSDSDRLLVALHGSNGSSRDFEGLEKIFDIPELNYLYLNGPIPSFSAYGWYSDTPTRIDALQTLEQAFDYIVQEGYPPKHIFLMGFSQGADLTFEFGVRYKHLLAGYIAISGRIEDLPALLNQGNPNIMKRGRWLVTHGTKDYNLSVDIMRQQVEQLRDAGFHIDYQEYEKIHEFEGLHELPHIRKWILSRM